MSHIPEPDQTPDGPAYEGRLLARPEDEIVDQGAGFDLGTLLTRRRVLGLVGIGAGTLALAACSAVASTGSSTSNSEGASTGSSTSNSKGASTPSASASAPTDTRPAAGEIPEETNGPYPADGSNGVNILEDSGIVRSDIRSSIGGGSTADGVPLSFTFTVTDLANGGVPFEGVAVYAWHCDARGRYSMYSSGVEGETFLRGIQVADAKGQVTFQTIVPGCYAGRWTHIHFEVYPDVAAATDVSNVIATSQVAFPEDMLGEVYALAAYDGSARNLSGVGSVENDNVFSDGYELQLGSFSGSATSGFSGSLPVGVDTTTASSAAQAAGPGGGRP